MNPQQPTTSVPALQVKLSKIKFWLLLISTIVLIISIILIPVAAVLNSNNFLTNDPAINSLVKNTYLLFALAVFVHGIIGLITVLPYRKVTKFYRSTMYLYGVAILSIPLYWIMNAIYTPLFSQVWTTEIKFGEPSPEIPLAVTILSSLLQYADLGIFCLAIACAVISIQLIRKK